MSQVNVDLVRAAYDAFTRGDVAAVLGFLHPRVEWTEAEGFPYGGTYVGPEAVRKGVYVRLGSEWTVFRAIPDAYLDAGDHVVVMGDYSGTYKATGKSFRCRFAHVWTVRDGKAARFIQFADTAKVLEALRA